MSTTRGPSRGQGAKGAVPTPRALGSEMHPDSGAPPTPGPAGPSAGAEDSGDRPRFTAGRPPPGGGGGGCSPPPRPHHWVIRWAVPAGLTEETVVIVTLLPYLRGNQSCSEIGDSLTEAVGPPGKFELFLQPVGGGGGRAGGLKL